MGRLVAQVTNEDSARLARVLDAKHRVIGVRQDPQLHTYCDAPSCINSEVMCRLTWARYRSKWSNARLLRMLSASEMCRPS